jgi:hypothetical protein
MRTGCNTARWSKRLNGKKELYSVGAAEYAEMDETGRNRLLVERVESIFASTTSQFIETHQSARGVEVVGT